MNTTIHDYLSAIGKKGGEAGKGVKHVCDPVKAKLQARRAAKIRWSHRVKTVAGVAVTASNRFYPLGKTIHDNLIEKRAGVKVARNGLCLNTQ